MKTETSPRRGHGVVIGCSMAGLFAARVLAELPLISKFGIASEEEVGIDSLAGRLRAETVASDGVVKWVDLVSAWARKP